MKEDNVKINAEVIRTNELLILANDEGASTKKLLTEANSEIEETRN